jgi:hypothetical protein
MRPLLDLFKMDDIKICHVISIINNVPPSYRPTRLVMPKQKLPYQTLRMLLLSCPNLGYMSTKAPRDLAIASVVKPHAHIQLGIRWNITNYNNVLGCLWAYPQFDDIILDLSRLGMFWPSKTSIRTVQHLQLHLPPADIMSLQLLEVLNLGTLHIQWTNHLNNQQNSSLRTPTTAEENAMAILAFINTCGISIDMVIFSQAQDITVANILLVHGIYYMLKKHHGVDLPNTQGEVLETIL